MEKLKKISGILIALCLTIFIGIEPAKANQDLLSEVVKKEASLWCGATAFSPFDGGTITAGIKSKGNNIVQKNAVAVTGWKDQTGKSAKGSKIVLPVEKFSKYGYCHIFDDHMKNANTRKKHEVKMGNEWKSQFQYAHFPNEAMETAMEVINGTDELNKDPNNPNRFTKTFFSYNEGQRVRVVLQRGSTWGGYNNYDWVLVSMFPVF